MTPPRDALELCPTCVEMLDIERTLAVGYPGEAAVRCDECGQMTENVEIVTVERRVVAEAKRQAERAAKRAHR